MDGREAVALLEIVGSVPFDGVDRAALVEAVTACARLRAWLDGREMQLAAQLTLVVSAPEHELAAAARTSLGAAERVFERVGVADAMPALAAAMSAGEVSGAHVDEVARVMRGVEPAQRRALLMGQAWVVDLATSTTPQELRKTLRREVRELQAASGLDRLEVQRGNCRLRTWVDLSSGMWCLAGELDPETGIRVGGRLDAVVEELAQSRSVDAPRDPLERHSFLRAHALVALTEGRGAARGRPEVTVVLDTTPPDGPVVDWSLPVELPLQVLHDLFGEADVAAVVVRNGAIVHAAGRCDLGRHTRLANRHQRRTLRAIYPTCAVPGCDARYESCKLHHVVWWEHGGGTDLDNLVPLCVKHHHAVHDAGWQLELSRERELTITYPDGSCRSARPPTRASNQRPPRVARREGQQQLLRC